MLLPVDSLFGSTHMTTLEHLIKNNQEWAERIRREDTDFFQRLSSQQRPEYLWIGCSDSRVPANQIIDMNPGEVFVHRNVANIVVHSDLNCLSVIQYAVDVLQVKHILVVGHYGCGGVTASMNGQRVGLVDNWIRHVTDVAEKHENCLKKCTDSHVRHARLCELNALEQVVNVCGTSIVRDAWSRGQPITVHGWVYSLKNGLVHDLGLNIDQYDRLSNRYDNALAKIYSDQQAR